MDNSATIVSAVQLMQKFINILSSTATLLVHIRYTVPIFESRT